MAPVDSDCNLLFGLLALQVGLIDQGALFAAFAAWTRDKGRPLADHLIDLGHLDAPRRAAVEAVAAIHVQALGGDPGKSLAVLVVGRSTRESLARAGGAEIKATLGRVGTAPGSTHDEDPDRTASYAVGSATSDGQRFRVPRPHAKGGLGAVFVALDTELHREVALKQILEHHADDSVSRQRFLLEAEITGGLEHPGIVPVYGLGSYGDGRPYYAMRFIKGDSLKQAIERFHADELLKKDPGRRSLELRKLLRRFIDICDAIDYAHSRGVLHRDIKPGNVILGKHGETLVVDWGLAKAVGRGDPGTAPGERTLVPSPSSGLAQTLPGSAMGTPAYMSPEQAAGDLDRLGPRSDVYSLGATLYCLLTGKPPFVGDDAGFILREVQQGEFPAPRTHDPSIHRALEAVCLKAMARKPEDRYGSPRALAEDVERWTADEPVAARREPLAERAQRWMRRRRTAVTAIVAAMLVAMVGLGVVLMVQMKANSDQKAANRRELQVNAELRASNERERAQFDLAMEAIRDSHERISGDVLMGQAEFLGLRNSLLESARDFYRKLEASLADRAERHSRTALGRSYFEIGELTDQIASKEGALAAHRQALAVREALASVDSTDSVTLGELAVSYNSIGRLLNEMGQHAEALRSCGKAVAILNGLVKDHPGTMRFRRDLAMNNREVGISLKQVGQHTEALQSLDKAVAILAELTRNDPNVARFEQDLANTYDSIADIQIESLFQYAEAMQTVLKGLAIRDKLVRDNPSVPQFRRELAHTLYKLGTITFDYGRYSEGLEYDRKALAIREELVRGYPSITQFRADLAVNHQGMSASLSWAGLYPEALEHARKAVAMWEVLVHDNPSVIFFRFELATSFFIIGIIQAHIVPAEAFRSYGKSLEILEMLVRDNPTNTRYWNYQLAVLTNLAILHRKTGDSTEARRLTERASSLLEKLPRLGPHEIYYSACIHALRSALYDPREKQGGPLESAWQQRHADWAMEALRKAVQAGYRGRFNIEFDLDVLRSRPDFQTLMLDLDFPSDPFAQ